MITLRLSVPFANQFFDKKAIKENWLLCGVDEVGRGCLAGPVVATAAILKPKTTWDSKCPFITDSKQMSTVQRELAYHWLMRNSWHATAAMHHRIIDATSIYRATLLAMERAVAQLAITCPNLPQAIVVDAMPVQVPYLPGPNTTCSDQPPFSNPQGYVLYFPFGETRSLAIAAASVIAKVTRDRLMQELHTLFPHYRLDVHKGYATPAHCEDLDRSGPSLIHRAHFATVANWRESHVQEQQLCIDLL